MTHVESVSVDTPLERLLHFVDDLPSLEDLANREETVKVTIALSKLSVEFFKREARSRRTQYQRMIRRLLDEYVQLQLQLTQDMSSSTHAMEE